MIGMVQDKKFKGIMMWLVCILSLALCLHSNTHVTETSSFQNAPYAEAHPHQHEVNQLHKHNHQDTYHEHFVGYDVGQNISFIVLIFNSQIIDRIKHYTFLVMNRIFKPPKKLMDYQIRMQLLFDEEIYFLVVVTIIVLYHLNQLLLL